MFGRIYRLFIAAALSAAAGCSAFSPRGEAPRETVVYRVHEIRYSGETLGQIADWYTGSAQNWKTLLRDNGQIRTRSLRFGDKVRIPERMMVRRQLMPQSFVKIDRAADKEIPRAPFMVLLPSPPPTPAPVQADPAADGESDSPLLPPGESSGDSSDVREELLENLLQE